MSDSDGRIRYEAIKALIGRKPSELADLQIVYKKSLELMEDNSERISNWYLEVGLWLAEDHSVAFWLAKSTISS